MCGICGVFNTDGGRVDTDVLIRMTDSIEHRGPDAEGYFTNGSTVTARSDRWLSTDGRGHVGLGHRRLSIIDLESGQQPMMTQDGRYCIVFNGEIYNFKDLQKQLKGMGIQFTTDSDTEVILNAYTVWGAECVKHLRGMFAFAVWDNFTEDLFVARDRLGIKPFYYYWDGSRFLFGSEIKAIIADSSIPREIDVTALADYFALLYVPAPKSIFKNIFKLEAGYHLTVKRGEAIVPEKYWDIHFNPDSQIGEVEWCERILDKLKESIDIRTISEVPLGAFLSGGIDSSAVVALLSKLSDEPIKTSSIGFSSDKFNELPYAQMMVEQYATDHHQMTVEADAVDILDKLVWHYDEPFADSSVIPTYYVSKMTRERVTVALSGDGGDENFAGYRRYYFDHLENRLRGVFPDSVRSTVITAMAKIYPKADWLPQVFRAKTLLTNLTLDPLQGYYNSMSWFGADKQSIFSSSVRDLLGDYDPVELFMRHGRAIETDDPLTRIQYVDMKTYLVDDILTKVDRASMANSLEVRVPLLDHEFMELVAQIPSGLKLKGKEGKSLLKSSLRGLVPDNILYRPKRGFSIPLAEWLRTDLKDIFEDCILRNSSGALGYLDKDRIEGMWIDHLKGVRDHAFELWSVLFFVKWYNEYLS